MSKTTVRLVAATFAALVGATTLAACGEEEATRDETTNEVETAGEADVFSLQVGDCFDDEDSSGEITDVPAVPCAESHDNEIYHAFEMEDGDWPGDADVQAAAEEGCGEAFEEFVGVAYDESELYIGPITPTEGSWEDADDREILCVIYDPAGPVEGSLEGAGR